MALLTQDSEDHADGDCSLDSLRFSQPLKSILIAERFNILNWNVQTIANRNDHDHSSMSHLKD